MKPHRLTEIRANVAYLKDQRWWLGKGRILRMLTDLLGEVDRLAPRTVTTVDELDALPNDTLIEDAEGLRYLRNGDWYLPTDASAGYTSTEITLPAKVLWTPDQ